MYTSFFRKAMLGGSVVQSGLILHLDPATYSGSGSWVDGSASGWNATLTNGPTFTSGATPYFTLDGTNDRLEIPIVGTFSAMTMQILVYRIGTFGAYTGIMCHRGTNPFAHSISNGPTANRLGYTWNNNRWDYEGGATMAIPSGAWTMLSVRVGETKAELNINGSTKVTQTIAATAATWGGSSVKTMIGVDTNTLTYLNMRVGPVMAYDRYLTDDEIASNYAKYSGVYQ
ncbi:Concanavalin A-like lectin/glucanases superfamily [uncultured Caudovirales phage]|uniref:Concanavalin A-like lectin/glucanases superfamily n=1 Tax=uncultured Caudovirales phage TaxID=2100421 RepID=A0A6J5R7S4_9CAUD|nr:Concanavalin A-like lectin/glucanases superfamily [uncultured Caudovirales phage]